MTWDESEHPRDEKGKFTFKNGGCDNEENYNDNNIQPFKLGVEYNVYNNSKANSPAEILLGNSTTHEQIETQKERNRLLNRLGNSLTTAQVLYSSVEELKEINQNNIDNKIENNFKYDFKKHDELKQLLQSHHDKNNKTPLPKGYKLLEKYHSDKTGLDVEIYEYENELIFSFPGSEQLKKDYINADYRGIYKNNKNPQLDEAQNILKKIKNNPEFKDKKIIVTGYSLGGNIAGGLSVLNNIEGVTFNPYGNLDKILQQKADDLGQEIEINPEKLINYRHENDKLSSYPHLGTNYTHESNFTKLQSNFYSNHDIKSLNDAIQRHPDEIIYNNKTKYRPKN